MLKAVVAAAVVAGLALLPGCASANKEWLRGCEVYDKQILTDISTDSKGKTTTTRTKRLESSCGPFNVEDAWEAGVFNSYDLWNELQLGKKYDLQVGGYRNGFLSTFQFVLDVEPANTEAARG